MHFGKPDAQISRRNAPGYSRFVTLQEVRQVELGRNESAWNLRVLTELAWVIGIRNEQLVQPRGFRKRCAIGAVEADNDAVEANFLLVPQAKLLVHTDQLLLQRVLRRDLLHGRVPQAQLDRLLEVAHAELVVLSGNSHADLGLLWGLLLELLLLVFGESSHH